MGLNIEKAMIAEEAINTVAGAMVRSSFGQLIFFFGVQDKSAQCMEMWCLAKKGK